MLAFALPPLPAVDPDAVANDRFGTRLRRADLAVLHRPAPVLHDRKIAQPAAFVTRAKTGASQCHAA